MNKLNYLFNIDYNFKSHKLNDIIKTNLEIYKMKKYFNNYDNYMYYSNNGYYLLYEYINSETILIKLTDILLQIILYCSNTEKLLINIYETIKKIY